MTDKRREPPKILDQVYLYTCRSCGYRWKTTEKLAADTARCPGCDGVRLGITNQSRRGKF